MGQRLGLAPQTDQGPGPKLLAPRIGKFRRLQLAPTKTPLEKMLRGPLAGPPSGHANGHAAVAGNDAGNCSDLAGARE